MPSERTSSKLGSDVRDKDVDLKHHRRHRDHLSANDAKVEVNVGPERKASEADEKNKLSDPTKIPHSRSYFQQDDRGTAAQDGRRSVRRDTAERGFWKDHKDDERGTHKAGSDAHEKDQKSIPRGGDSRIWRHDRFSEMNTDPYPLTKKRRHFREEKLPSELDPKNPDKAPNLVSSITGSENREERPRDRRPLERNEQDRAYGRERSFATRARDRRVDYVSRGGFSGGDNGGGYRGRDRFGGRQGYRGGGTGGQVDKWKHDMYDDANRSPTSKNDEDPVAKVEALLAL